LAGWFWEPPTALLILPVLDTAARTILFQHEPVHVTLLFRTFAYYLTYWKKQNFLLWPMTLDRV
jgi:hypothetical protein